MSAESSFADGGCTCRFVRFRMTKKPLFVHCCHCRWCQRETGASFALNALIEADHVQLLQGEVARYRHAIEQRQRSEDLQVSQMSHRALEQLRRSR